MAKQRTTGQGVVEALKGVSATEGNMGAVYGAAFKSGLDPIIAKSTARKKEREAENKAILKAAGVYLQGLDSNVDTVGLDFSDTDKAEVKRVSIEWRNEFADYANELARIEDKTSAEALELQDKMNGIKSRFNNLRANLEGVAKYKQEFRANIDLDGNGEGRSLYSTAGANKERLAQGNAILTESFTINDEGGIVYADQTITQELAPTKTVTITNPGFIYQHNNFKKPFEQAVNTVNGLTALYEQQASKEGPIAEGEKKVLTELVNKLFTAPGALESFIADNDQLTEIFDFSDISLDDDTPREEVQREVVNRLVEAMGEARKPKKEGDGNNNDGGTYTGQGAYMIGQYNQKRYVIPYPGTPNRAYFLVDKNGDPIKRTGPGGTPTKEEKATAVGYQMFTRKNANEDWMTDTAFKTLPLNNPRELYLQNNNIIKFS